ncbi:nucleotidyltransferase domain-containing protein [Kitasatospora sp. NPDC057223]|uniref:nucleotidyltransferase domain-containing protein n=1 Tax=Kitasatospora sp. NPDC057223 TaxID=3346055 RepID=UPI0036336F60
MTEALPPGGVELTEAEAEARWTAAWTPAQAAARLAGVAAPWCVAGGWALDLFRGGQTREHSDLEIAVPAALFPGIRARLTEFEFDVVASGQVWEATTPELFELTHQTWVRDPSTGQYLLDVFREPHDGATWICRRDPSIRLPYTEVIRHTADGIPYLAPELALLFKAKALRPKDLRDFTGTLPLLDGAQRRTLAGLLARVHPGHSWLTALRPGRPG